MKFNKGKGKVHPSPSPSPSSSSSFSLSSNIPSNPISILNLLLPAAILPLIISILSPQDTETLAYIIIRSLNSQEQKPTKSKSKPKPKPKLRSSSHESPSFGCDCFECYMAYWSRWNSSPNRELIHEAIEAFEDNLAKTEQPKKSSGRSRRREKAILHSKLNPKSVLGSSPEMSPEKGSTSEIRDAPAKGDSVMDEVIMGAEERANEKGLVRNVIGFFNIRLWNLWGSTFSLH